MGRARKVIGAGVQHRLDAVGSEAPDRQAQHSAAAPAHGRKPWDGGYSIVLPDGRRSYRLYKRRCKLCGKAHHETVGYTLAEAEAYLRAWTKSGHRPPGEVAREEAAKDLHFADAVAGFTAWASTQLAVETIRTYKRGLKRWGAFLLERGVFRLSQLTPALWQAFPAWRTAHSETGKAGAPSVFADQVAMRNLVKWALAGGQLEMDPFPKVRCPAVKVDTEKTTPRDVTLADVEALAKHMTDEACRSLLWCMYWWGVRGSSWRRAWQVFPEERAIYWPGASNKNDKGHRLATDKPERFAPVLRLKDLGVPPKQTWADAFRAAKLAAKLPHLRPHDLRAACAQRLEDEGRSLTDIMETLQWTQYKVARRYLRRQRNRMI